MKTFNYFAETCTITCENNSVISEAEVYSFKENDVLVVTLQRAVKLSLRFNGQVYTGSMGGLTFVSDGPALIRKSNVR